MASHADYECNMAGNSHQHADTGTSRPTINGRPTGTAKSKMVRLCGGKGTWSTTQVAAVLQLGEIKRNQRSHRLQFKEFSRGALNRNILPQIIGKNMLNTD